MVENVQGAKKSSRLSLVVFAVLLWVVFGVSQSLFWTAAVGTSGYTSGFVPGALIGAIIGSVYLMFGKTPAIYTGLLLGSVTNFYNVATLGKTFPVDVKTVVGELRLPIFVVIPGGIVGALTPVLIEHGLKVFRKKK